MSLLIKSAVKSKLFDTYRCLCAIQTRKSHWYPYFKPGPYPRTKEEREAAAKKYNLLPEEYEPYPEGSVYETGDYPKLPFESVDSKDPWYPWEDNKLQRGFNEAVHSNQVILFPEFISTDIDYWKELKYIGIFVLFVIGGSGVYYFLSSFKLLHHVMEKQYPSPGVTHYTFEMDYEKH